MIPLMVSSILLLLVLQGFWLQKEYQNEKENFRKQTHLIFKNTIFEMSDSLLFKSVRPEKGNPFKVGMNSTPDSVKILTKNLPLKVTQTQRCKFLLVRLMDRTLLRNTSNRSYQQFAAIENPKDLTFAWVAIPCA
jgi:hypothetical protein